LGLALWLWRLQGWAKDSALIEANTAFTYKGEPIHPGLIEAFQNSLADYRPPMVVTVDVGAAFQSNAYYEKVEKDNDQRISIKRPEENGQFSYQYLGRLQNDIHVLLVQDKTGGTGAFSNLTFICHGDLIGMVLIC